MVLLPHYFSTHAELLHRVKNNLHNNALMIICFYRFIKTTLSLFAYYCKMAKVLKIAIIGNTDFF